MWNWNQSSPAAITQVVSKKDAQKIDDNEVMCAVP